MDYPTDEEMEREAAKEERRVGPFIPPPPLPIEAILVWDGEDSPLPPTPFTEEGL